MALSAIVRHKRTHFYLKGVVGIGATSRNSTAMSSAGRRFRDILPIRGVASLTNKMHLCPRFPLSSRQGHLRASPGKLSFAWNEAWLQLDLDQCRLARKHFATFSFILNPRAIAIQPRRIFTVSSFGKLSPGWPKVECIPVSVDADSVLPGAKRRAARR